MKQSIVIPIKSIRIDKLRKKYDPYFSKIKTHVTLVYPFEVEDQNKLIEHINYCLEKIESFEITFHKLRKSKNFLVLDVERNREKLLRLYKLLNSGILSGFENKELSIYLPHITLGIFNSNPELMEAIKGLRGRNLDFRVDVKGITLLTLNEDNSIKTEKSFNLGNLHQKSPKS